MTVTMLEAVQGIYAMVVLAFFTCIIPTAFLLWVKMIDTLKQDDKKQKEIFERRVRDLIRDEKKNSEK